MIIKTDSDLGAHFGYNILYYRPTSEGKELLKAIRPKKIWHKTKEVLSEMTVKQYHLHTIKNIAGMITECEHI